MFLCPVAHSQTPAGRRARPPTIPSVSRGERAGSEGFINPSSERHTRHSHQRHHACSSHDGADPPSHTATSSTRHKTTRPNNTKRQQLMSTRTSPSARSLSSPRSRPPRPTTPTYPSRLYRPPAGGRP
ncbi:hypothetical protein B0T18DRAFT_96113 [Schizothecium vesticola]|uniref:Uncharacterized protein n=1 Tax=Schizothecium vesticola TaxID=314040 RepID=A0AA40F0M4_9PEZI|nr:hypothetical protein B0T18DRAFT_96113 [Schizothecium vesticola]